MRLLTIFFLTLLIFALPLQGIAAVAQFETPCPLKTSEQKAGDKHGCCKDAETAAKTGTNCKSQQNCQSGSLGLSYVARPVFSDSSGNENPMLVVASPLTVYPSATWRPPNPA